MTAPVTVYVVLDGNSDWDLLSVHGTYKGAKRAAEQAAGQVTDGWTRSWRPAGDIEHLVLGNSSHVAELVEDWRGYQDVRSEVRRYVVAE